MSRLVEEQLACLATETQWRDLPSAAQDYAEMLTVDALANAVAGRTAETALAFEAAGAALAGRGRHAVCAGRPLAAWAAAGQNAYQMTAYTMCDVYRPALCHVTPEVVPAALAAAELVGSRGPEFLLAVALGLEVTARVCLALDYPAFRARGWHAPGVAGALGAAAAAGRLLDVGHEAMTGCLGLAGAQAAGTFAGAGTVAVKFHQVSGARAGLAAAAYAAGGFAGSPRILTADDGGILSAYSGGGSVERAARELGQSWELRAISMRAYPAASTLQALVDCLLSEAARDLFGVGQVQRVSVWLPPQAYRLGTSGWDSQLAAMQSAKFVTSAVLHLGSCWLDTFGPAHREDPDLIGFASRCVDVLLDDRLEEGGVRVMLSGSGGDLDLRRDWPHGDARNPLTPQEVHAKAARSLGAGLPSEQADAALPGLYRLRSAATIAELTDLLTVPDGRAA